VTEAFLLGTWLGGALCYWGVLSSGADPMPMRQALFCAAGWLWFLPHACAVSWRRK
jgi:hypothetical protein